MAKIKHADTVEVINTLINNAKQNGLLHLTSNDGKLCGRHVKINQQEMLNFGTCGYMGLEADSRIIHGAMEYAEKYGVQYSISRTFASSDLNEELDHLLSKMYDGLPVVTYSSTSTAHISIIPILVQGEDTVILDQQVHFSVQTAVQLLRQKNVEIDMIRHNDMDQLETKILELKNKRQRIWYMVDGTYSMYGDLTPINELVQLMEKYPQLHVYIDDAHGMSWNGKHGTGYIFNHIKDKHNPQLMLVSTLAKGFGVVGGIGVFSNPQFYEKVKTFGGPYSYSHPLAPPMLGAAIASANIHLSDEIYVMQAELKEKLDYCNALLQQANLPVTSNPETPIYMVAMGQVHVGQAMCKKLLEENLFTNLAMFPVVPIKCTGLRFTLTRHHTLPDIKRLVDVVTDYFPVLLEKTGIHENEIRKNFGLALRDDKEVMDATISRELKIEKFNSINEIDQDLWDHCMAGKGIFDWEGLKFLEELFQGNEKPEENWKFHYFVIKDAKDVPVLVTFFTSGIYKDDLLSPQEISMRIEEKRKEDPYYLTSMTLAMGSLLTEGEHLYLDRDHTEWKNALSLLLKEVDILSQQLSANVIYLRDFDKADDELRNFFIQNSFFQVDMPNTNIVESFDWNNEEEFLQMLGKKKRGHYRRDVAKYTNNFNVDVMHSITDAEAEHFYQLFMNIKNKNFSTNFFDYPKKLFKVMSRYSHSDFTTIRLKPELDDREEKKPIAMMSGYKTKNAYCCLLVGMDYNYLISHRIYKQMLYQVVLEAQKKGASKLYFGFTADLEKSKLGAKAFARVAYVQAKDNYHFEVIAAM